MLDTSDHRRDSAGLRYVYPVVSRRAGGVSLGINLNINNACNWACLYCQVDNLQRGGPPPIELDRLAAELDGFLAGAAAFMQANVPEGSRRLVDVAFSGNGEPTSSAEFAAAVERVGNVLGRHGLLGQLPLRLITNGSFMHRPAVCDGIRRLGELGGEVWFKIDRADESVAEVNGVPFDAGRTQRALTQCLSLAPTWVQTCWFALDGQAPSAEQEAAYCRFLAPFADRLGGIHLYGLARPSLQAAAPRLGRLPAEALETFSRFIQKETGIRVLVSP